MTFQAGALLPAARVMDLVTTETADATLVYDLTRHELHQLNPVASIIWGLLNGKRTATDVLVSARAELGPDITIESVQLALVTLADANLLADPLEPISFTAGQSRRRFLKKAGIVSIPAILSVTVPSASASASGEFACESGWTPFLDGTGICGAIGATCCNNLGNCGFEPDGQPRQVSCGTCTFNQWNCQSGYYMQPYTYGQGEKLYQNGQQVGDGSNTGQCVVVARCQ